jgi:BACON domain-containing protein
VGALSQVAAPVPLFQVETPPLAPESTPHEQITEPLLVPVHEVGKHQPRSRLVKILFIAGMLSLLLASSILTYLVLFAGTGAPVHPAVKVVHAGSQQGQFTSPQLQLSDSHIDFGTVSVQNSLTLTNVGNQQVNWQAGVDSNSSWLGITPTYGTFSKKETAIITVNRSNLTPQAYTGYINFFQQGSNNPLTLKVTMQVTSMATTVTTSPPPAILTPGPSPLPAMVLTTNTLTFSAIQGNNPTQQAFTLANPGNAPLNWAISGDANATTLLSITPKSGTVAPGSSVQITILPIVSKSTAGVINAILTIHDTDPGNQLKSQQVTVKITISNQALISVSTTNIACNLSSTITSSTQQLQITNSGSATLNWALSSQSLPSWISVDSTGGTLPPGYIAFVNVACNNTGFQAGAHTSYTLVVSDTDPQTPVAPQNVQVTLAVA